MKDNSGSNENATKPYTRGVFEEVVCAKCGKSFIPAVYHKFVDKKKRYYCKWTCYNHRAEKYPDEKETTEIEGG